MINWNGTPFSLMVAFSNPPEPPVGNAADPGYQRLCERIQTRFLARVKNGTEPVFMTETPRIWQEYLSSFAPQRRQYHNCNACRRFLETYGSLVTVDPDTGVKNSVFWKAADAESDAESWEDQHAISKLEDYVNSAPIAGVFLSSEPCWGTPRTDLTRCGKGDWRHFGVTPPARMIFNHAILTAGQAMAEKVQDHQTVMRALGEYRPEHLAWAVELLESEALYRSEKVLGSARWLRDLQTKARGAVGNRFGGMLTNRFADVVWRAVASAPAGFCHPRSSMIGTLLDDLAAGMDFETVKRRFAEKMNPTKYQRPQAPPAFGNIARAEKIVAELAAAGALKRRFATIADVQEWLWQPSDARHSAMRDAFGSLSETGVFAGLAAEAKRELLLDTGRVPYGSLGNGPIHNTITWDKFQRTVLPGAKKVEVHVPSSGPFVGLVTAADPAAPPIIQWDRPDRRNPVSWYLYVSGIGRTARRWSLVSGTWVRSVGICASPPMWNGGGLEHQGEASFVLLEDCHDTGATSLMLFPEILRSEFREVRSTIEAYSGRGRLEGSSLGSAAGLKIEKRHGEIDVRIRATSRAGIVSEYTVDRWD